MRAPAPGFKREIQVGIFVFAAILIIAAFSFRITDAPIFRRGTRLTTYLDDATGVFKNSKVKIAGIDVGVVTKIELDNGRARLTLIINPGIEIPKDAKVVPRPLGILGDKFIEVQLVPEASPKVSPSPATSWLRWLVPEAHAEGPTGLKPGEPAFHEGETIKSENNAVTLDDIQRQMGTVSTDVKQLTGKLNKLVDANGGEVSQMLKSLNRSSTKLESIMTDLDSAKVSKDIKELTKAVGNLSQSVKRIDNIIRKIDEGEGTAGHLINDPTLAQELERAATLVNAALERARRTVIAVDIYGEYALKAKATKTFIGVELWPREDFGYLGQVIVDKRGKVERTITTKIVDGGTPVTEEKIKNTIEGLKFSFLFAKRLHDFRFRLGVMENAGGFGVDYFLMRDRVLLGADLFNFDRLNDRPYFRIFTKVSFLEYFYVYAGGDDLFTKSRTGSVQPSVSLGLGIHFTDDDLKTVLVLPGLL